MNQLIMERERIQMSADKYLLDFENYEDYLDSLINYADLYYLRSTSAARMIAELGYRSAGETLDRRSFSLRQGAIKNHLNPPYKPYIQDSQLVHPKDPLQVELILRERLNRLGILSTIIFLRVRSKNKFDVSGYIDYADRLASENWQSIFHGKKNLIPRVTDLAFYNWRTGQTKLNETKNYQPTIDIKQGLAFKNIHDRRFIYSDPKIPPKSDTTRLLIKCDKYEHIVLYDHFLTSKS